MKNLPEKIYLDFGESIENIEDFPLCSDVTWSTDNATGMGVEYIRKDVAEHRAKELTKWNKVEDCLPEKGTLVLCMIKSRIAQLIYFGEDGFCYTEPELVTEWKQI